MRTVMLTFLGNKNLHRPRSKMLNELFTTSMTTYVHSPPKMFGGVFLAGNQGDHQNFLSILATQETLTDFQNGQFSIQKLALGSVE